MTIQIGNIIKKLRTEGGVTQEMLAGALSITPQAISRWESGATYPDLEFLPIIAEYFSITIDELLGYKLSEREEALVKIKKECDRLGEIGTFDEQIAHARQALIRYPADFELKATLAGALYCKWEESQDSAMCNEIETLCESVLENCRDIDTRYCAVITLCSLYGKLGRAEKAYETIHANLVPMKYRCEAVLSMDFGDGEVERYKQDEIGKLTDALGLSIRYLAIDGALPNGPETWNKKIEMLEIANKLYYMIYGENLMFNHTRLSYNHWLISTYQIAQGKEEEALNSLEKMSYHALQYDKSRWSDHGTCYSSILTDKLVYPYPNEDSHELSEHNDAYYMLERLQHKRYDRIKEHPRFAHVVQALKKTAE